MASSTVLAKRCFTGEEVSDERHSKRCRMLAPEQRRSIRCGKRARLEQLYCEQQNEIESAIISNIQESRASRQGSTASNKQSKRRKVTCLCKCCERQKTANLAVNYTEQEVQHMIAVALETQKEKLLTSFVDEHLAYVERQREANAQTVFRKQHDYFI